MLNPINKLVYIDDIVEFSNLSFKSYSELITFFKKYSKQFWDDGNIYVELHHIIPRHEKGGQSKENLVYLPFKYHFIAHCLLAIEKEKIGDIKLKNANFWSANAIICKMNRKIILDNEQLLKTMACFDDELYELKEKAIISNKGKNAPCYGRKRSREEIKRMIENQPKKPKYVYCIETEETYFNTTDAAEKLGLARQWVSNGCRTHRKIKGYHFFYIEKNKTLEEQIKEYKTPMDLKHENRLFYNPQQYIDLKTKQVVSVSDSDVKNIWDVRNLHFAAIGKLRKYKGTYWSLYDNTKTDSDWNYILDEKIVHDTLPGKGYYCPELNRHFTSSLHIEKELGISHSLISDGKKYKNLTFLKSS